MKRSEQALIELLDAVNREMHEHIHTHIKGAIRDSKLRIPFPGMMIVRQVHREPGITVAPHDGQDSWSAAPQLMQKCPAPGVGWPQVAQMIVSELFMP